ncbi:hypothetical protein ACJRO7_028653 [Eucalyptus globulus]|uniref:Gnk2-homologous domain-containing protein n=1 Tax=Eucalyptus globulus TaxID=34317 RepID=A0ABD3JV96_EUCGL
MAVPWRIICLAIWFFCIRMDVKGNQDVGLEYKLCNGIRYQWGDTYGTRVESVLKDLVEETRYQGYSCFGHAACDGALLQDDCFACLFAARNRQKDVCPLNTGAQVHLKDFRISYENYQFIE